MAKPKDITELARPRAKQAWRSGMKINVTRQHVMKGMKYNSRWCPVALAVTEATGSPWTRVDTDHIEIGFPGTIGFQQDYTPELVRKWIEKFDRSRGSRQNFPLLTFDLQFEPHGCKRGTTEEI